MIKAAKAFGGAKAYDISIACPCRECDVRSPSCGRICSDYKKYKFVLAILNGKRQAKAKAAAECREMHDAADVEAVLTEILVNFRNQIRGIPSKMAPLLFGKSKPEIEELLSMEVEGRLEEIRDYTPTMFDAVDEKEGD